MPHVRDCGGAGWVTAGSTRQWTRPLLGFRVNVNGLGWGRAPDRARSAAKAALYALLEKRGIIRLSVWRFRGPESGEKKRGAMLGFDRITFDPHVMGGRACIRDMRITVSLLVNLVANEMTNAEIIDAYPYLEPEDIHQALHYVAWLAEGPSRC